MKVVFNYNQFVNNGETTKAVVVNNAPAGNVRSISDEVCYQIQASAGKTSLFVSKSNLTYMVVCLILFFLFLTILEIVWLTKWGFYGFGYNP